MNHLEHEQTCARALEQSAQVVCYIAGKTLPMRQEGMNRPGILVPFHHLSVIDNLAKESIEKTRTFREESGDPSLAGEKASHCLYTLMVARAAMIITQDLLAESGAAPPDSPLGRTTSLAFSHLSSRIAAESKAAETLLKSGER